MLVVEIYGGGSGVVSYPLSFIFLAFIPYPLFFGKLSLIPYIFFYPLSLIFSSIYPLSLIFFSIYPLSLMATAPLQK